MTSISTTSDTTHIRAKSELQQAYKNITIDINRHKLFLTVQKECIDDILLCNQIERSLIYQN